MALPITLSFWQPKMMQEINSSRSTAYTTFPNDEALTAADALSPSPIQAPLDWISIIAIVLVAIDLRPGIVSMGPLLPQIIRSFGLSHTVASLLVTVPDITASFMAASPVFGALSKHHDRRGWLALGGILALAGIIPLIFFPTLAPFIWVPLTAFGLGGAFTLAMTLPLDNTHDVEDANVWNAFVLTVGYLIAAAGPLFVGAMRDVTGSFHAPMMILIALAATMLTIVPFLRPRAE